jgi:hypothetical protein
VVSPNPQRLFDDGPDPDGAPGSPLLPGTGGVHLEGKIDDTTKRRLDWYASLKTSFQEALRDKGQLDYIGSDFSFPTRGEGIYAASNVVVGAGSSDHKSPAEFIAAVRGQREESREQIPIRSQAVALKPAAPMKKASKRPSPRPSRPSPSATTS